MREHTSLKYMYITSVHLHVICTSLYMSMLVWYLHHAGHAITSRPAWSQRVPMSSIQYTCMILLSAPILKCVGSSVNKSKSIRLKFKRSWFETQLDLKFFLPSHTCTCICIAILCIPHTHTHTHTHTQRTCFSHNQSDRPSFFETRTSVHLRACDESLDWGIVI